MQSPVTPIPDNLAKKLKAADRKVDDHKERYEAATQERADLMIEAMETATRGEIGRLLEKSPERIRQIVDRRLANRAQS